MLLRRLVAPLAALLTGVTGLAVVTAGQASAAPALPPGFVLTALPSGLGPGDLLTGFAYLPDRSVLSIGKNGKVAWVSADGQTARTLATIPVETQQDRGLIGLAVAADYGSSRRIYLTYVELVGGQPTDRLVEWTVTGGGQPTGLSGARPILDVPSTYPVHNMTGVMAAPDGTLWVSMGDSADFNRMDPRALRAQDPDGPYGKIFHITRDGYGVPGNPFYDSANPGSWRSRSYASGLRSPFRFGIDPGSGALLLGDVGWRTTEEIDLVRPGANFGWPCWEGNQRTPDYSNLPECAGVSHTPPVVAYPRSMGSSVTAGVVYTGESYPAAYRGAFFFGDYTSRRLYSMQLGQTGQVVRQPEPDGFAREVGAPVYFTTGPNGDVVFAELFGSKIMRLGYTPGNRPPTAAATSTTDPATRTVTFDGGGSFDPDGDALSYAWDFGDGGTGSGAQASHSYPAAPAAFTARLTVTDPAGASATTTVAVAPANHPPALTLTAPPADHTHAVGDPVVASATASDAEDGPLAVRWTTDLLHCHAGACHNHPGLVVDGPEYRTTFANHEDETTMRVTATATDSAGVSTTRSFVAQPRLRTLTLAGNLPAAMTINGNEASSARVIANATVSFAAPEVSADGVATFDRWSDGGPRGRSGFVMPDADVTLTAGYLTPIDRRYAGDPGLRTTVGAPVGAEQGGADLRWRDHERGRLYWTPAAGVHEVHGAIRRVYLATGGHEFYGAPVTDESITPDGVGRYNHFARPASVYWTPSTDAHVVYGAIRTAWARTGWERGPCGYPITDETGTPDGVGRYNHFTKGCSIYWTPSTGAHEVHGAIRTRWASMGWERSYLGYPTSDEFGIPGGRRSNFWYGYVTWNASTGQVIDRRY